MRLALQGAWERSPHIAALNSRRTEIEARKRVAGRITPGPPSLGAGHLNDYLTGDDGYREYSLEIGTPLWLPGEGTALRRVAAAELAQLDAELSVARLAIAGEVREAYWRWAFAGAAVEVARRRLDAARALEADTQRQERSGQASRADVVLARAETAEARASLSGEDASLTEARLAFRALTGVDPPAGFVEPEPLTAGRDTHPLRIALRRSVDVTDATHRLLAIQDRDSPQVALLGVIERSVSNDPYDKRLGLRVVIPFATEGRNEPRRKANEAVRTRALAELRFAGERIAAAVEAATAEIAAAEDRAALADERHRAMAERLQLVERSARVGETPLVELVRARAAAFEAESVRVQSRIAVQRARSRLNQALGLELSTLPATTEGAP